MRSRYKILILLFTVTLTLGALTLLQSSNDNDAVLRFRSLFSNRTLYNLKHPLASITDGASLWYGGLSLFAIIMIVLVFRIARRNDTQRPGERFAALKAANAESAKLRPSETVSAKAGADTAMRAELKMMTDLLQEKDATITELENSLSGKQQLIQNRSKESDELKSKVNALTEQLTDFRLAKERAENALQQEVKKTKILQAKDSVITGLESNLTETQKLSLERSQEVDALKSQVNALTEQLTDFRLAKERAENLLQREIEKTKILQEKDSVIAESEDGLSGQVHALERELNEKQELLQTRSKELKAAKSKVNTLRERLTALGTAKNQTENVLQQQLKKKTELLQAKDAAIKELQESLSAKVHALEAQLEETQKLLEGRDIDSALLGSERSNVAKTGPGKTRAQSLLLQELQNRAELLEAKDAVVKELEERLNSTVHALENTRSELEKLAKQRDTEIPDQLPKSGPAKQPAEGLLRPDRKGMNSKLLELGAAKARTALSLQAEEAKRVSEANDSAMKELGDQGVLLADKDKVLESDDGRSEELNTEATKRDRNQPGQR
jgi:chromosome segregation ATPase